MVEVGVVAGEKSECQGIVDPELFLESPPRRRACALAGPRMSAARIRPQPARMIFARAAPLQEDPPLLVDDEDRECAMQQPGAVDGVLAGGADRAVSFIDQDQRLVTHRRTPASFAAL